MPEKSSVIVIPWVDCLYMEIIHKLKQVDYLTYRWSNIVELFYTTYISVDLAHHEIVCAKVGKEGIISLVVCLDLSNNFLNSKDF